MPFLGEASASDECEVEHPVQLFSCPSFTVGLASASRLCQRAQRAGWVARGKSLNHSTTEVKPKYWQCGSEKMWESPSVTPSRVISLRDAVRENDQVPIFTSEFLHAHTLSHTHIYIHIYTST